MSIILWHTTCYSSTGYMTDLYPGVHPGQINTNGMKNMEHIIRSCRAPRGAPPYQLHAEHLNTVRGYNNEYLRYG